MQKMSTRRQKSWSHLRILPAVPHQIAMGVFQMLKYQYAHSSFVFLTLKNLINLKKIKIKKKSVAFCIPAPIWTGYSLGILYNPHIRLSLIFFFGGGHGKCGQASYLVFWLLCFLSAFILLFY